MDLLSISKKLSGLQSRGDWVSPSTLSPGGNKDAIADRLKQVVKQVNAKRPIKDLHYPGSSTYPIDVNEYGQFLSTLQMMSWIFRDLGYMVHFLTRGGLSFDHNQYLTQSQVFTNGGNHIVALVANAADGSCFRISRDTKTLRYRSFNNIGRALAPMRDGDVNGSRPISVGTVREIVRILNQQTILNPKDETSLRKWGRLINCMRPASATTLKNRVKMEFRKVKA